MATIQFKKTPPSLFILGQYQFYAILQYQHETVNKVATYNYPFIDGVDYDSVGVGEESVTLSGLILSYQDFGDTHMAQLEAIVARVREQKEQVFAHPEIGSFPVIVTSFTLSQSGEKEGYEFQLSMNKVTRIREREMVEETTERVGISSTVAKQTETYTIKRGDCLWNIAKAKYGDPKKCWALWEANKKALRSGKPHLIYPGEVITLPAL